MQKYWDIARKRIPEQLCKEAAQEAQDLFDFFGEYEIGLAKKSEPINSDECPFLNFRLQSTECLQKLYDAAPAIGNILLTLCRIKPSFGTVPTDYFPSGITINFANETSHVPLHLDKGSGDEASYITTLTGKAEFMMKHLSDSSERTIKVEQGDVHMLYNPANLDDRVLHGATTIGSEPRISLAARIPLLNSWHS